MQEQRFNPIPGLGNPHLQTLLPRLCRRRPMFEPFWQRLELPDGDFVDLAWSEDPNAAHEKSRVVLFHGLEGSFYSPYAHGLLHACREKGWISVVMHFRGCSGEPNRKGRIYHSGETEDARFFLRWLQQTYGQKATAAVGVSLGGNMLANYLAQEREDACVDAAVLVSAPLDLAACSKHIEQGVSLIYNHYLLGMLKQNVKRKLVRYPGSLPVELEQLKGLRKISEFDDIITARVHGFNNAMDYYQRCSALPHLHKIVTPLLIIHAQDDPFMTHEVIPKPEQLPANIEYQLTRHGGHVGFVGGSLLNPVLWLERRIPDWLNPYLEPTS